MKASNDNSERVNLLGRYHSAKRSKPGLYAVTGEFRAPKKGEWYLSGAIIEAYQASNDFPQGMEYWIAKQVSDRRVARRRSK